MLSHTEMMYMSAFFLYSYAGRFLPLLIGHLVPEGDCFWDNFLMLLTIMDYVFAPVTTADKADYVAMLVEDFLVDFRELYPERRLIPKMHYMIHLPTWMKLYGLLTSTSVYNFVYFPIQVWSSNPIVVYAL